tara:strand:- start:560 stop:820 length:261 start_codon:yes stop_codon:yes gene_type:complete
MTSDLIPDSILDFYESGDKMDKQSYKEMLADNILALNTTEKEVSRLQILVAKYQDKEREIKKLVYDNPNNMALGKKIRNMFWEGDE